MSCPYLKTVALELILIDSATPGAPWESLGISVASRRGPETLSFTIPLSSRLLRFDEIKVIFHRAPQVALKV